MNANLIKALQSQKSKYATLNNLVLFGRVRCLIDKPKILGSLLIKEGTYIAILDVFGILCKDKDYFQEGTPNPSKTYFTKGSVLIATDRTDIVGVDVKVSGKNPRYGLTVKQQLSHTKRYDGITALCFNKVGDSYEICPNSISTLGDGSDLIATPIHDYFMQIHASESKILKYPISLDCLLEYEAVSKGEYSEIKVNSLAQGSSPGTRGTTISSQSPRGISFLPNGKVDVTSIDLHLVHNPNGRGKSKFLPAFKEDIETKIKARESFIDTLVKDIYDSYRKDPNRGTFLASTIRNCFIDFIASRYSSNIGNSIVKGNYYVKELLSFVLESPITSTSLGNDEVDNVSNIYNDLLAMVEVDPSYLHETDYDGVKVRLLESDIEFALGVISVVLGVSHESLRSNFNSKRNVAKLSMDSDFWFYLLCNCPYILSMIGSGLSVVDCDKIYLAFNEGVLEKECDSFRKDLIFLQTLENTSDKDTFIKIGYLSRQKPHYDGRGKRLFMDNGYPARKDLVEAVKVLCNNDITLSGKELESFINVDGWYSKERENSLQDRGIITDLDGEYLALERDIEKQVIIYETLVDKGSSPTGTTQEDVNKAISSFQDKVGFNLEKLQVEAVGLCKYKGAVVSGCAGSGKTTTSDCMIACDMATLEDKGYTLVLATPTGKASRRLTEVTGIPAKTCHSEFGIGMGSEGYLFTPKKRSTVSGNKKVYYLDEFAMANINLLYEVCRNLSDNDVIRFLGDISQLPPIGRGNPFYYLMRLLPCIELGVSKRAAEGSDINYNVTLLNKLSDGVVQPLCFNNSDFIGVPCSDVDISNKVLASWGISQQDYPEDDIQVICGFTSEKHLACTPILNKSLSSWLRQNDRVLFTHLDREFHMNERVIHLNANLYGMPRYIEVAPNVFQEIATIGVVNGEVGKVVGIVRTDMARINKFKDKDLDTDPLYASLDDETKKNILDRRETYKSSIRDDSLAFALKGFYFVKVLVHDAELDTDVILLYKGKVKLQDTSLVLGGTDLGNLDYAYALTCHKMQGSQSKVVIVTLDSKSSPTFINRNMLNTMITRTQDRVYLVGSVEGKESALELGRLYKSKETSLDAFSILVDNSEGV